MTKKIIEYTCFFTSIVLAFVIAIYVQFDINIINKMVAILTVVLLALGIASVISKNARKGPTIHSKSESTVNLALAPEEKAQELIDTVNDVRKVGIKSMEKIKKVLHWCNLYKSQLIGLVGPVSATVFTSYVTFTEWFDNNIMALLPEYCKTGYWLQILLVLVFVILTVVAIRNQCVKVGFGSIEYAEKVVQERAKTNGTQLSEASKKHIRDSLKELKKQIDNANKELLAKEKDLSTTADKIKSDTELLSLGLANQNDIAELSNKKVVLENEINNEKIKIKAYEDTVIKYQNALK